MYAKKIFLISSLILCILLLPAVHVVLGKEAVVAYDISYISDPLGRVNIDNAAFQKYTPYIANGSVLAFASYTSPVWLKIDITNHSNNKIYITVINPTIDSLQFYYVNQKGDLKSHLLGYNLPLANRSIPITMPILGLNCALGKLTTIYVKLYSREVLYLPIEIGNIEQLYATIQYHLSLDVLYFGMLLCMFLYTIFLAFSLRSSLSYLLIAVIFFQFLYFVFWKGYSIYLPEYLKMFFGNFANTIVTLLIVFSLLFFNTILELKLWQKTLHHITYLLIGLSVLIFGIELTGNKYLSSDLAMLYLVICNLYIIGCTVYAIYKKKRRAWVYFISFGIFLIGPIYNLIQLHFFGEFPLFIVHAVPICTALQVFILTIEIASQANLLKEQKQEVLEASLVQANEFNEELATREEQLTCKEEELRQSLEELSATHEELYKTHQLIAEREYSVSGIIDNSNDFIFSVDTDLNIVHSNKSFTQVFSKIVGLANIKNKSIKLLWEPNKIEQYEKVYSQALLGNTIEFRAERIRPDSSERSVWEESYKPIFNAHKEIEGIAVFVKEVTKKVQNEEEIINKDAQFRAIINSSSDFILSLNKEFKIVASNHAFESWVYKNFSITIEQGKTLIFEITNPELQDDYAALYSHVLQGRVEVRYRTFKALSGSGDTIHTEEYFSPIKNIANEITGIAIIARDVTERKKAEQLLQNKTQELIRAGQQMAEYKLMALRSVMNPHFLFNSLNSIQYFITNNERGQALSYLSQFAKLIRHILNSSISASNTLSEEIEIARIYVKLESLRFTDKFKNEIFVDPELDLENFKIPSLVLQPYIENAILHGLCNLQHENGLLKISFMYEDDHILCIVEDNGVGREEAKKIKKANNLHKSVGLSVTEERLSLINKDQSMSVKIIDLYHLQGAAAGTKVEVRIKIQNE